MKEFTDPTSSVYNEQYKNLHIDIGRAILHNNPFPCLKAQGDADCDGKVTRADLSLWVDQNANNQTVDPARSADFDGDGDVDRADLSRWINGFANPAIPH